jgi:adenine-specific DNA-methyltransferase
MKTNFKTKLYYLLKKDFRLWDEEKKEFNETLLKDLIDKLDKKIIELLLGDKETNKKFFVKVKDVYVLKQNELKFFIDENKLDISYTQYQNKIGLKVGNKLLSERDEVVLDWPFKDCVLEGGMTKEDQKRNEIFFNEVLAKDEIDRLFDPKTLVNWKRYTTKGEEKIKELKRDKDGKIRENLIIKGNNLLTLHCLKKQFAGKVKLIYIDPPYNTGNDSFKYNDNFNHSTWLTFIKNRLEIAKDLLRNDGVIIIHLDDNEIHYLKILMDEVFNRENFINTITIKDSHPSGLKTAHKEKTIIKTKSHIICYSKSPNIKINPLYQSREDWDRHFSFFVEIDSEKKERYSLINYLKEKNIVEENFKLDKEALKNNKFKKYCFKNRDKIFQSTKEIPDCAKNNSLKKIDQVIEYKGTDGTRQFALNGRRLSPLSKSIWDVGFDFYKKEDFGKLLCDFWDDIDFNNSQNEGGVSLASGKKPEFLLARIISLFSNRNDIVLDFFAGSGTTGAVAHKIKRQYILIEQMDYIHDLPEARLKKVIAGEQSGISKFVNWQGGGDFVYVELAKWNEEAKEKILKTKSLPELEKLFDELYERYFLNYNVKTKEFKEKILKEERFKKLSLDEQKNLFVEMLDMNQMYVNFSERADIKYNLSKEDIALNEEFYNDKK